MRKLMVRGVIALCLLGAATTATAGTVIAYDNTCDSTCQSEQQNYGNSLGLDFEVLAPIDVLALGMFDGNNNVNQNMFYGVDLSSGVTVLIYNIPADGPPTIVASVYFNPANFNSSQPPNYGEGEQINAENFLFLSSAVELQPGNYSVVAWNDWNWNINLTGAPGGTNPYTTENDGGGLILFDGGGRYDPAPGSADPFFGFPTIVDAGPNDRYMAGSFIFENANEFNAIPEPSTLGLIGAGLLGAWALRRRRRQN
ncbi:MAG: PEP-CTERM sorting domain-containing protein [Bryobacteraceae bacterium]